MRNKISREERREAYKNMSNKERIQYDGKRLLKILKVFKRIAFFCALICLVLGLTFISIGAAHQAKTVQDKIGLVELEKVENDFPIVSFMNTDEISLEEDTPQGWDKLYISVGVYSIVYAVLTSILILIMNFMRSIFGKIVNAESPFCEESKPYLRKILLLLAIVIFMKEQVLGVVSGFIFLYLYRLFAYGCDLQKESDETL